MDAFAALFGGIPTFAREVPTFSAFFRQKCGHFCATLCAIICFNYAHQFSCGLKRLRHVPPKQRGYLCAKSVFGLAKNPPC